MRHLLPIPTSASSIRSSSVMHEEELDIGDGITSKGEGTGDFTM